MEQKWPSHLVIVRHGESERNKAKEAAKSGKEVHFFGSGLRDLDTKLTTKGHLEALAVGEYIANPYRFDVVFSSPYRRAMKTAEDIISKMTTPKPLVVEEERIREIE